MGYEKVKNGIWECQERDVRNSGMGYEKIKSRMRESQEWDVRKSEMGCEKVKHGIWESQEWDVRKSRMGCEKVKNGMWGYAKLKKLLERKTRGESNSPSFDHSVLGSSCNYLIFGNHSLFFSWFTYFLEFYPALRMPIVRRKSDEKWNRKRGEYAHIVNRNDKHSPQNAYKKNRIGIHICM